VSDRLNGPSGVDAAAIVAGVLLVQKPSNEACRSGAARPAALGLDSYQTSVTEKVEKGGFHREKKGGREAFIEISRVDSRRRRMRAGVSLAARVLDDEARAGGVRVHVVMQTLTYAPGVEWSRFDVSRYRACVVAFFRRRGVVARCVWVAELTKLGRLHYHALWWLPMSERIPMADARGWWRKGHSNTQRVGSAVGYISKGVGYVAKGHSEKVAFPAGVRIHGASGLSGGGRTWRAWQRLPAFLRVAWPDARPFARRLRGEEIRNNGPGFVDEDTGELVLSPWRVVSIRGGVVRLALALPCNESGAVEVSKLAGWQLQAWKVSENAIELLDASMTGAQEGTGAF
jgi:hypothetical protein